MLNLFEKLFNQYQDGVATKNKEEANLADAVQV